MADGVDTAGDLVEAGRLARLVVVPLVGPPAEGSLVHVIVDVDAVDTAAFASTSPSYVVRMTMLLNHSNTHRLNVMSYVIIPAGPRLPSQSQSIAGLCPVPNYTAW